MRSSFANQYNTTTATSTMSEPLALRGPLSAVTHCEGAHANTQRWQILLGVEAPGSAGLITQSYPPARWNPEQDDLKRGFRRFDSSQDTLLGHHLHWVSLVQPGPSLSSRCRPSTVGNNRPQSVNQDEPIVTEIVALNHFTRYEIREIELRQLARKNPTVILPPARTAAATSLPSDIPGNENDLSDSIIDRDIRQRYENLLIETAHDLRAPISTARQLINTVSHRAKNHGSITAQEVSLLEVANRRLAQASQWASSILVSNRLVIDATQTIRQRFYPQQWQALMRPLLQAIASDYDIRLLWVGWDRSLPQLYLDVNQLSRVVLNLVTNAIQASEAGGQISIRTSWEKSQSPRLVIHVEDQGQGLSQPLLRELNASQSNIPSALDTPGKRRGIGLDTVKRLVPALGASLSAQNRVTAGAEIRLTLPVDEPRVLFRNWFSSIVDRSKLADQSRELKCSIFGIRWLSDSVHSADKQIQQFASPRDFVYRIADDRWLLLTMADADAVQSTLNDFADELAESRGSHTLRAGRLGQTESFTLRDLQKANDSQTPTVPSLINQLISIAEGAMQNTVPRIDDLEQTLSSLYSEAVNQCLSRPGNRRAEKADRAGTDPSARNERNRQPAGNLQRRIDRPGNTTRTADTSTSTWEENTQSLSEAIEHLSSGWKHRQNRLRRLRDTDTSEKSGVSQD